MEKIVILTESQLKKVISKTVQQAIKDDKGKVNSGAQKEWLTNKEVCELLSTTLKTMQNFRDKGIIPFSKIGSKIYYQKSDIDAFLKSNYHPAFNQRKEVVMTNSSGNISNRIDRIIKYLTEKAVYRHNVVTGKTEFKSGTMKEYEEITDYELNSISLYLAKENISCHPNRLKEIRE